MAFSSETNVLTKDGYRRAKDIVIGMILPTPLGDTEVLDIGLIDRIKCGVTIGNVLLLGIQRCLGVDLNWKIIHNVAETKYLKKIGSLSDSGDEWLDSEIPNKVFSFHGNVDVVQNPLNQTELEITNRCRIKTGNGVLVLEDIITEGYRLPSWKGKLDPIAGLMLPTITQEQLDKFKAEYF